MLADLELRANKPVEKPYELFDRDALYFLVTPSRGREPTLRWNMRPSWARSPFSRKNTCVYSRSSYYRRVMFPPSNRYG